MPDTAQGRWCAEHAGWALERASAGDDNSEVGRVEDDPFRGSELSACAAGEGAAPQRSTRRGRSAAWHRALTPVREAA